MEPRMEVIDGSQVRLVFDDGTVVEPVPSVVSDRELRQMHDEGLLWVVKTEGD
jgi:hypothetical protein